VGASPLMIKP